MTHGLLWVGDSEPAKSLGQRLNTSTALSLRVGHCSLFSLFVYSLLNHHIMSRAQLPKRALTTLYHLRFERFPNSLNCARFNNTQGIASDDRHPLQIPFSRRLEAWNPDRLHWIIKTPMSISKKRTVRSWVMRRFRDTFIDELEKNGFNRWGEPVDATKRKSPLTGALAITITPPALTASVTEVRGVCNLILQKNVISRQRP